MNPSELQELVGDLRQAGGALARLARDDTTFRAVLDAFLAGDGESFQRLLQRNEIGVDCELICGWLCSKECVRTCLELCGLPPQEPFSPEEIAQFADVVVHITSDEELVERLADAVEERDRTGFQRLVSELQIERFCHVLCHWACSVRCRLRCEVVCAPVPAPPRRFVTQLSIAGAAIRTLAGNRQTLDSAVKAALAFNCPDLTGVIGGLDTCIYVCEWICSWRCALVCLPLCRPFPPLVDVSIDEMRAFAQAVGALTSQANALERVVSAIDAGNADAFSALLKELQLERFCLQLCHWVCAERCRLYCRCVCPSPTTMPMFTHVGQYRVDPIWGDFTAAGTTSAGGFAFTTTIPLIGILPDGTAPDALEYRFRTEKYPLPSGQQDVTAAMIAATVIGELEYWDWDGAAWILRSAEYWVNNPGVAPVTIHQPGGADLGPFVLNKIVKPGGWIEVPRENQLYPGGIGRFVPTGGLANLDTTKLTDEHVDLTVAVPPLPLQAGDSIPASAKSEKPSYKLYFEARKVVGGAAVSANNLPRIALSNTHYTYNRHPDWDGGVVPAPWNIPVVSLDLAELRAGGGCVPLETAVHALFTAYHPYLGTCDVRFQGPSPLPPTFSPPALIISADGEAVSVAGGQPFNIAGLNPCAYIVWLEATLNLTAGYGQLYGMFQDQIAFCKR